VRFPLNVYPEGHRLIVIDAQNFIPNSGICGDVNAVRVPKQAIFAYAPGRALRLSYTFRRCESFSLLLSVGPLAELYVVTLSLTWAYPSRLSQLRQATLAPGVPVLP
jgi:hypothetical protein